MKMDKKSATYFKWFETNEGEFIGYTNKVGYDSKINPENISESVGHCDKNYDSCPWPTINDLIQTGKVMEANAYDEYLIEIGPGKTIADALEFFAEKGINVTREALEHNYKAWKADYKSGYRDEENGYHVFSGCRCNELYFCVTTLCDLCDWQTTFVI